MFVFTSTIQLNICETEKGLDFNAKRLRKKIKQINAKFARTYTSSTRWAAEILVDFMNCSAQKKPAQYFLATLLPLKLVLPRSAEQQEAVTVQLQPFAVYLPLDFSR